MNTILQHEVNDVGGGGADVGRAFKKTHTQSLIQIVWYIISSFRPLLHVYAVKRWDTNSILYTFAMNK